MTQLSLHRAIIQCATNYCLVVSTVDSDGFPWSQVPQPGIAVWRCRHQVGSIYWENAIPDPPLVSCRLASMSVFRETFSSTQYGLSPFALVHLEGACLKGQHAYRDCVSSRLCMLVSSEGTLADGSKSCYKPKNKLQIPFLHDRVFARSFIKGNAWSTHKYADSLVNASSKE